VSRFCPGTTHPIEVDRPKAALNTGASVYPSARPANFFRLRVCVPSSLARVRAAHSVSLSLLFLRERSAVECRWLDAPPTDRPTSPPPSGRLVRPLKKEPPTAFRPLQKRKREFVACSDVRRAVLIARYGWVGGSRSVCSPVEVAPNKSKVCLYYYFIPCQSRRVWRLSRGVHTNKLPRVVRRRPYLRARRSQVSQVSCGRFDG